MRQIVIMICCVVVLSQMLYAQEREVLIPKPVPNSPFRVDDSEDVFGRAYRWFLEGEIERGAENLRELIVEAGYQLEPDNYYVVVANFTGSFSPIGIFHGSSDFFNTRMFGLGADNLFYIFITRDQDTQSYVSVLATAKPSPSEENLLAFLSLFLPISSLADVIGIETTSLTTFIDIRQFEIPGAFRKNSDLSFLVKTDLADEDILAGAVFDNTSKERWSYGIGTAITSVDDVDIIIGGDGTIIVKPKPC